MIELAPLALVAPMKRLVTGQVLPKGPVELTARSRAELAELCNSAYGSEGAGAFGERRKPRCRRR